jgi:hypothetical protein
MAAYQRKSGIARRLKETELAQRKQQRYRNKSRNSMSAGAGSGKAGVA